MKAHIAVRLLALAVAIAVAPLAAGSKTRIQADPHFDFRSIRTWAWDPEGAGQVMMARASEDDPEAVRRRLEPVIVDAVTRELRRRHLEVAADHPPDLRVHYYVLVTVGTASQQLGQFLPAVPDWPIPPFSAQTSSLEFYQTGSLVLDFVSPALGHVVWRGVAEGKIDGIKNDSDRDARIRDDIHSLAEKLPITR